MRNHVVSLYDYTGEALKPWARAGFKCFAYDIQHGEDRVEQYGNGGTITYRHADLYRAEELIGIANRHRDDCAFMSAFPVCTDLAVSGARHFATKAAYDPGFQFRAAGHAVGCSYVGRKLGCPYYIENPVSRLATLWRQPDFRFHPFEYGGYIEECDSVHPTYPDAIAPRDAYSKLTCLWTGGGFVMPERKPVGCESYGASRQFKKLGGKSQRTKNIRSATPRGFAIAVMLANTTQKGVIFDAA